ncbi:hypothetical protein [Ruminococcus sp.]|uniref:hypothetical protein n=1 Tax=Ruminococcus sp. TaxID=41978 RepID=UPI001B0600C7|nr:hypothetical protein [Ruminococcus sp.]MBO5557585.1 hypothetical protein [Ruminococcus sp.]
MNVRCYVGTTAEKAVKKNMVIPLAHHKKIPLKQGNTELMLSFPRLRRGKDKRQLYSVPDITSFILVCQRDDRVNKSNAVTL